LAFTAGHFSEAKDFAQLMKRVDPYWFVVAVTLQAATCLALGEVFRVVAHAAHEGLALSTACRLSFAKLFVDLRRPTVAAGIVVELASYYFAYVASLAAALVIAAMHGEANGILYVGSGLFFVFAAALSTWLFSVSGRSAHSLSLPPKILRWRPLRAVLELVADAEPRLTRSKKLLLVASIYQLAIVVCDAATLWALVRSLAHAGSLSGVFASFMISSLLRTIGFMPGGLGIFEAASSRAHWDAKPLRHLGAPAASPARVSPVRASPEGTSMGFSRGMLSARSGRQ
jgi:Mg2+-importing ATPase